jgi:hypothetical protein
MTWTTAQREGFALGAIVANDRGAALGASGLAAWEREALVERARQLAGLDRSARRRWLADTLTALRGVVAPVLTEAQAARVPQRALALLATHVPHDVGERWLAGAPLPRAGYTPEPALRALLARRVARAALTRPGEPAAGRDRRKTESV